MENKRKKLDVLSEETKERLEFFPKLKEVVEDFIENDGMNPNPLLLTPLTVYIRQLQVDEPSLFEWDEDTAEDFYTWGHNSRYSNVLEPMLIMNFEFSIEHLLDWLEEKIGANKGKEMKVKVEGGTIIVWKANDRGKEVGVRVGFLKDDYRKEEPRAIAPEISLWQNERGELQADVWGKVEIKKVPEVDHHKIIWKEGKKEDETAR
jgi:hypothetical protein